MLCNGHHSPRLQLPAAPPSSFTLPRITHSSLTYPFTYSPQVKVNFTGVTVSAMEDFIGRGDRRIGAVIASAWRRGALNDAWWENEASASAAWSAAIEEAGLTWKYRQVAGEQLWGILRKAG